MTEVYSAMSAEEKEKAKAAEGEEVTEAGNVSYSVCVSTFYSL